MYQVSHYGGLEYLAHQTSSYAVSSNTFYSAALLPSYDDRMFIPFRDYFFSYASSENKVPLYSLHSENYTFFAPQPEYHFLPENFLKPGREGIFVGKAEEVRSYVEEAFELVFHQSFPNNIKISILSLEEFRKIAPSPHTIGLSVNRNQEGLLSEVFILNDSLARVMLTIGHELGHVLTKTLPNQHDEEAKAYAFSLVWMKVIQQHNVANLGDAIVMERPADNGLHNVAFRFVHQLVEQGRNAWEIYAGLVQGEVSLLLEVGIS